MAVINADDATKRFEEKLNNGFFRCDRSQNTEVNYAKEKAERDTIAVEEFAKTELYQEFINRS